MTIKTDIHSLKAMAEQYAIIDDGGSSDVCAVYADGDRRRRPMAWLPRADLDVLYQHGHLKRVRKGYAFSHAAERAFIEGRWSLSPDMHMKNISYERVYVPSGVQRMVRRRNGGHILRRLSRERGPNQQAFLTPHEIQAGELFQKDYAKCFAYNRPSVENFSQVQVDRSRENSQEMLTAAHIDATTAFEAAKAVLGPGLEQAAMVICGEGKSLDSLERAQEWSRGSGRMILKLALQRLVRYYGTCPGSRAERGKLERAASVS